MTGAITAMDDVLDYFHRESMIRKVILDGPSRNLDHYLETMVQLDETIEYFSANSSFKSSEVALKQLSHHKSVAKEACERLYGEILEKCSVPMEPSMFPAPLPKELELIEEVQKSKLLKLSEFLVDSPALIREYAECRGRFFLGTIRKLPAATRRTMAPKKGESFTPSMNRLTVSENTSSHPMLAVSSSLPTVSSSASLADMGNAVAAEDDVGKYFGEFVMVFLRIAEHERRLASGLFGPDRFSQAFASVFEAPFDLFFRLAEATVKTRPRSIPDVERVFYLLDTYDDFSGKLKSLNQVTKLVSSTSLNDKLGEIVEMFRETVKQSLTFFLETVQRDNVKVGADGNVHPMASRTLNYLLKRLLPKRTCVEFLVDKWLDVSTVTLEVIILTFCNELCLNLEEKAKRLDKKQPILANIFLLNNYHYILHTISNNNMLPPDLLPTFSASYETKIHQEIAKYRASWNHAIEWLADPNKAQITAADYKTIKAKFNGFNKALEKLFHTQKMYSVPNTNLRQELRELAKSIVVPLYKSFLARYAEVPFTKNRQKYERYTVETLVEMLSTFFSE